MIQIHRKEISRPDQPFLAPKDCTFAFQDSRRRFSVWFRSDLPHDTEYIIVGTGHDFLSGKLRQSFVMPDGHCIYHLIEI